MAAIRRSSLVENTIELPIQFNGKLKTKIQVANGLNAADTQAATEADATVRKQLDGKTVIKVNTVLGRMGSFVVRKSVSPGIRPVGSVLRRNRWQSADSEPVAEISLASAESVGQAKRWYCAPTA